jgi:hypothetical protein
MKKAFAGLFLSVCARSEWKSAGANDDNMSKNNITFWWGALIARVSSLTFLAGESWVFT